MIEALRIPTFRCATCGLPVWFPAYIITDTETIAEGRGIHDLGRPE